MQMPLDQLAALLEPIAQGDFRAHAAGAATDKEATRRDRAERAASGRAVHRSEEHTSELQSLMRISYAVFCLKKKKKKNIKLYKKTNTHKLYQSIKQNEMKKYKSK